MKQKIVPCLWFDKEAVLASEFYVDVFGDAKITSKSVLKNSPSGDVDIVEFNIFGFDFMAFSAGPEFKINPSISFIVGCETKEEIDSLWGKLSEGGKIMMPLDKYFFSERYGFLQDKFGVAWQLIVVKAEGDERPKIVPSLLFVGDSYGKTEKAVNFYLKIFKDSKLGDMLYYEAGSKDGDEGKVMFSDFKIKGTWIAAMDGKGEHDFKFNEAVSFIINCKDQDEIDYFWEKLSVGGETMQCGWVKDKFGVSWQINPENMGELMAKNPEKTGAAMMGMKKIIIADLKKAGRG
jgi:predicted 3-demethylubiquinone-9 3-methyltransferase (glyoxalase superfamily)